MVPPAAVTRIKKLAFGLFLPSLLITSNFFYDTHFLHIFDGGGNQSTRPSGSSCFEARVPTTTPPYCLVKEVAIKNVLDKIRL